jgi:hypothetical protein
VGAKYAQDLLLLFFNIFFLDDSISNVTNISNPIAIEIVFKFFVSCNSSYYYVCQINKIGLKGVVINMIYLFNQQMLQVCIMKDKMKPNQKVNKHMIDGS